MIFHRLGKDLFSCTRHGKKFSGTFRQCFLFYNGYGMDQAAELRFLLKRK